MHPLRGRLYHSSTTLMRILCFAPETRYRSGQRTFAIPLTYIVFENRTCLCTVCIEADEWIEVDWTGCEVRTNPTYTYMQVQVQHGVRIRFSETRPDSVAQQSHADIWPYQVLS